MGAGDYIHITLTPEFTHNGRAYHSTVTGHIYFRILFHNGSLFDEEIV